MARDQKIELKRPALKQLVLCAYMMSGIDGHMDESEIDVIMEFIEQHWTTLYGDRDEFFMEVDSDLNKLLVPGQGKFEMNNKNLTKIISKLTLKEEQVLLELMKKVMEADGIIDPSEKGLIKTITDHMSERK